MNIPLSKSRAVSGKILFARNCALAFAQGKLSIKTPDLMHTGEIDGWSYLVMTRLAGQASREVWASVGQRDRLEIVSRLGWQ